MRVHLQRIRSEISARHKCLRGVRAGISALAIRRRYPANRAASERTKLGMNGEATV